MNPSATDVQWDESTSAPEGSLRHTDEVFESLFERSADAIWLYDPQSAMLVDCNQAAVELIGAENKDQLLRTLPADVSPPVQPDGRDVPVEVSSTALEMGGKSMHVVISRDISERKKAERALRESEEKFRALFEGSSQGVVLHDENELLEVNPAAVRIMRRQSPREMLGKHPRDMAPPFQPNGESSDVMGRKYIEECMTKGSARFEWLASAEDGTEIPLEVALTRIEWSGRKVIQAFITDITERMRAQAALAESEARFSAAFQASPIIITISRVSDEHFVLV